MNNRTHSKIVTAATATLALALTAPLAGAALQQSMQDESGQQALEQRATERQATEQQATEQQAMQATDRQGQRDYAAREKPDDDRDDRQMAYTYTPVYFVPTNVTFYEEADYEDVRELLGEVVEAALDDDGFDDLVERLNDQDRNRIGEFLGGWINERDNEEWDKTVEMFERTWEQKFGNDDFDFDGEDVFTNIGVAMGEITDGSVALSNFPVSQDGSDAQVAGGNVGDDPNAQDDMSDAQEDRVEDANLEKGRNIAVVALANPDGGDSLYISLLNEFPGVWKIDIPNDIDGEQLYVNLNGQLRYLANNPDKWPATEEETRQLVGFKVLQTLYGLE